MTKRTRTQRADGIGATQLIVAAVVLAPIVAVVGWAVASTSAAAEPYSVVALVVDVSPTSGKENRCDDIVAVAAREAERAQGELRLALFASGDAKSADEPTLSWRKSLSGEMRVLEGVEQQHAARASFLAELRAACEALPQRKESPLFRALQTATAHVSAQGCAAPHVRCAVIMRTDGIEEADARVVRALRGEKSMGARIDNTHVDVELCALADRVVRKRGRLPGLKRVADAYRSELTAPERAQFLPTCR